MSYNQWSTWEAHDWSTWEAQDCWTWEKHDWATWENPKAGRGHQWHSDAEGGGTDSRDPWAAWAPALIPSEGTRDADFQDTCKETSASQVQPAAAAAMNSLILGLEAADNAAPEQAEVSQVESANAATERFTVPKPPPAYAKLSHLSADTWTVNWMHACNENSKWLVMGFSPESSHMPWCGLCGHWAEIGHLKSDRCRARRSMNGFGDGPILTSLLTNDGPNLPLPAPSAKLSQLVLPPPPPQRPPTRSAPFPSELPLLVPTEDGITGCFGRSRSPCKHPKCTYAAHVDPIFEGFCCGKCRYWHTQGYKKAPQHGPQCRREDMPAGAHHAVDAPSLVKVDVQEGVDIDSNVVGHLVYPECLSPVDLCLVLIEEEVERELVVFARARVDTGWMTFVTRRKIVVPECNEFVMDFSSAFKEPPEGWRQVFTRATSLKDCWQPLDQMWPDVEDAYVQFLDAQKHVRQMVQQSDMLVGSNQLQSRNKLRSLALGRAEDFIEEVRQLRTNSHGWCGGAERELRFEIAVNRVTELEKSISFDVDGNLQDLRAHHADVVLTKTSKNTADTAYKNARYLAEQALSSKCAVDDAFKARKARIHEARDAERAYFKKFAEFYRFATRHVPEVLPQIMVSASQAIRAALHKLTAEQQDKVVQVLTMESELSHYDQDLTDANLISSKNARHALYKMSYCGKQCVLKVFDLHTHRGLPGFIQEVVAHVCLRHPLVVPLQYAFLDLHEHRGFLHFDLYRCNLEQHIEKLSAGQCWPHPDRITPSLGLPDRMAAVRRIVHAMIQSVQHLHNLGYVHGDVKLTNWLWSELPLLCDFETARDCGADRARAVSTTRPNLGTDGYIAPELLEDPMAQPSAESDIYSLGCSITRVLQVVGDSRRASPELHALESLAHDMLKHQPNSRITAAQAAERWWECCLNISDGLTTHVSCDELFYSQQMCSAKFSDGRPLKQLIDAVCDDPDLPLKDERLILDVVKKDQKLWCLCNRRLFCFNKAQQNLPERQLWIRVNIHQYSHIWDRFQRNLSTRTGGKWIRVRRESEDTNLQNRRRLLERSGILHPYSI